MSVKCLRTTTASTNVPIPLVHFSAIVILGMNWMKMDYDVNVSDCYTLDNTIRQFSNAMCIRHAALEHLLVIIITYIASIMLPYFISYMSITNTCTLMYLCKHTTQIPVLSAQSFQCLAMAQLTAKRSQQG